MSFQVRSESRPGPDGELTVWVLEGSGRAEVCPALGFNCFRWAAGGGQAELLFATPTFLQGDRPTRSGIPVLFPFPNRIRDGRFTWEGKEYRLPLNDPAGKNAIHGFACRRPWRVIDQGANATSAWVTGEFHCAADAPEALPHWPADHRLRLTCRLLRGVLRLEAVVDNPDRVTLPFGLGYHPYFRVPGADVTVQASARQYWQLQDSLPTGTLLPVDVGRDLNAPRRYADLQLDDVLTGLDDTPHSEAGGLCLRGRVEGLRLYASAAFRDLVVFAPPHRQAMCLEPYTCPTDAINLQQRGLEAGLLVLPPGERWEGVVDMVV